MEQNGYTTKVEDVQDLTEVKSRYQVPIQLQSCHTAIVDGYIIEGHVPVTEIERLITERPDIAGLAVPGMPVGSPGMEVEGVDPQPFEVIAFDKSGRIEIFASYPGE
jgi:hypothetical protein